MKILLISTLYPEPAINGIYEDTKAVHYFAKEWVKMGHEVVVIHPYRIAVKELFSSLLRKNRFKIIENKYEGVKVIFIQMQILRPHSLKAGYLQQLISSYRVKKYLKKKYNNFIPDIMTVHFPFILYPFTNLFIHKYPSLAVVHNSDLKILNKSNSNINKMMLHSKYNMICCRSKVLRKKLINLGIAIGNTNIIYSGIDENFFASPEYIQKRIKMYNHNKEKLRIVFAGKLTKQKSVNTIINAINIVKNELPVKLDIVGDGEEKEKLIQLTSKLQLRDYVTFIGKKTRTETINIMKKSDVFVMVSSNETFGLVYLEAMAQGCIVIGSKNEGIDGTILDSNNGYLVGACDERDLANCFMKIRDLNMETRNKIIKNAYITALKMTDKKMAIEYLIKMKNAINFKGKEVF